MCGPHARLLVLGVALAVGVGEPVRAGQNPYAPNGVKKVPFDGPFEQPRRPAAIPKFARPDIALADKLNATLTELKLKDLPARHVPLDEKVLRRLNVTCGKRGAELAVLRRAGTLTWPEALRNETGDMDCRRAEGFLQEAVRQAKAGKLRPDTLKDLGTALEQLGKGLIAKVNEVPPGQYLEAKRFLNYLGDAAKALEDAGVAKDLIAAEELPTKCKSAAALMRYMIEQGFRFAPAMPEDVPAYEEAARALAEYAERARPRGKGK